MTTNSVTQQMLDVDSKLHSLVGGIDILNAVNPLNYNEEREAFFNSNYSIEPKFTYKMNTLDSFNLKRALFNLPIEKIEDEDLRKIYLDVVDSYVDKVDQFNSIGTPEFLYDSLRYYGEPSKKDIGNAKFVLHLPKAVKEDQVANYDVDAITQLLKEYAAKEGYEYSIEVMPSMMANALVSGTKVLVNERVLVNEMDAHALAHHELGVHLATTLNARSQPLKILSLGCPVNTRTQEGLAILSEYLSGNLSHERLRTLALRVIGIESMIKEKSFRQTFLLLKEQYHVEDNRAFTLTARIFRGGGFTKDYLYLQGFHQMLNLYEQSPDFLNLLVGKTSHKYLPEITRLIEKGIFKNPERITPAFMNPVENSEIKKFIAHAIA